jgi:ABC-2 type transport system ATP-binding protein
VLALLGQNGAGKTTFLRLAFGLLRPTQGEIRILSEPAAKWAAMGGSHVAGVGENCEPPRWASLSMLADLHQAAGGFDRNSFAQWCQGRDLQLHRTWAQLSKGQKRWVLCGLALARQPEVLLLDEPADGLDPLARKELFEKLRSYADQHAAAVIVTTHILADVERAADRVAILHRGRLVLNADLESLREQVREIEFSPPADTAILSGLQVLGRRRDADAEICWVRSRNLDTLAQLDALHKTRGVGLEELFALVTQGQMLPIKEEVEA